MGLKTFWKRITEDKGSNLSPK